MSKVYSLQGINREEQVKIAKRLTVKAETRNKGKIVYGEPFKIYSVSEDKKWISVPYYISNELFPPHTLSYDFSDLQEDRPSMNFTSTLLENEDRDQQTSMNEALSLLKKHHSILLALRTGYGKSICANYLACQLKKRTLVLLCRSALLDGWKNEVQQTSSSKVVLVKSSGNTKITEETDVIISMVGRINSIDPEILASIGTLILDEAVDFCTPTHVPSVLSIHPQYIILLTATPTRPDKLDSILYDIAGPYKIVRKNQNPFTVLKLLTGYQPMTIMTEQGVDWNFLQYDLYLSPRRNQCILDCLLLKHKDHKIMILTNFEVHVDLLVDLCEGYGLDVTRYAGKQKSYENARILIGTTKKIGVGFDEKSKCETFDNIRIDLLLLVCSTKQPEALAQFVGRVFRAESPNVIHFVDEDARIKGSHWRAAKKWYDSVKGEITEFHWTDPYEILDQERFNSIHTKSLQKAINTIKEKEPNHIYVKYLEGELNK